MIYKVIIQHSTNNKNNTNTLLIGANSFDKVTKIALDLANSKNWKEAVVVSIKE